MTSHASSTRALGWLLAGTVLGAVLVLVAGQLRAPSAPVRDIESPAAISRDAAKELKQTQYRAVRSVRDVLSLPTQFMQQEAVYALAGRLDHSDLAELALDANRVVDERDRERLLHVFFSAMASSDPGAALDVARSAPFQSAVTVRVGIWEVWGRDDLDDALRAASSQFAGDRAEAAKGLFLAYGILGNESTDRIKATLGMRPSRELRQRYLQRLLDEDRAAAISYVDQLDDTSERREALSWLAAYPPVAELGWLRLHADDLTRRLDADRLREAIDIRLAEADPRTLLELSLASGEREPSGLEVRRALEVLMSDDMEAAMRFVERAGDDGNQAMFRAIFADVLAERDPESAIEWAKSVSDDPNQTAQHLMRVMSVIARSDPELAFTKVMELRAEGDFPHLMEQTIGVVAQQDPALATTLLARVDDQTIRRTAGRILATTWANSDPEAALAWIATQEAAFAAELYHATRRVILQSDVKVAMRMLDSLPPGVQPAWRRGIAVELASRGRIDEAETFIFRFEGQDDYDDLRAAVATSRADADPEFARRMAASIQDPAARDRILSRLITYEPGASGQMLNARLQELSSEQSRVHAVRGYLSDWMKADPPGAMAWLGQLESGPVRANAILGALHGQHHMGPEHDALASSIADPAVRSAAKLVIVMQLLQTDPGAARARMNDDDLLERERMQLERIANLLR